MARTGRSFIAWRSLNVGEKKVLNAWLSMLWAHQKWKNSKRLERTNAFARDVIPNYMNAYILYDIAADTWT